MVVVVVVVVVKIRFYANKQVMNLRKTKKLLKHRFWTEIYEGAKMFYFSGVINGKYLKNEVKQLTLFISRVKVRESESQH